MKLKYKIIIDRLIQKYDLVGKIMERTSISSKSPKTKDLLTEYLEYCFFSFLLLDLPYAEFKPVCDDQYQAILYNAGSYPKMIYFKFTKSKPYPSDLDEYYKDRVGEISIEYPEEIIKFKNNGIKEN